MKVFQSDFFVTPGLTGARGTTGHIARVEGAPRAHLAAAVRVERASGSFCSLGVPGGTGERGQLVLRERSSQRRGLRDPRCPQVLPGAIALLRRHQKADHRRGRHGGKNSFRAVLSPAVPDWFLTFWEKLKS